MVSSRDDPEHLLGIATLSDMERSRRNGLPDDTTLREICTKTVRCALPDEAISDALEK